MKRKLPPSAKNQLTEWARKTQPALAVPSSPNEIGPWRLRLRRSLRRLLACPGNSAVKPRIRLTKRFQHDNVLVHRITVTPNDRLGFQAIILEPIPASQKRPAWLCLHGCIPGGMSAVTGLIEPNRHGHESLKRFECDYALQLTLRGYVTLSFHFPGFGPRSFYEGSAAPTPAQNHNLFFGSLMLGRPYLGWCLADARTAVQVLRDWPTVQRHRIGATGFSMGGTLAAMLAAVEPHVKAAAVSGRFPSWLERLIQGRIDGLACVPDLLNHMDVGDILAALAPKPLFVSQEVRNDLPKARRLLTGVRRAYRAMHAEQKLTLHYDHAPRHRFVGQPLYQWIEALP